MARKYGRNRDFHDVRDQTFHLARTQPWPIRVDYSASCDKVLDQQNWGSCTGHAGAGVAGWIARHYLKQPLSFSPAYLYDQERIIEGTFPQDAGAQIRTICKAIVSKGMVFENAYPYTAGDLTTAPTPEIEAVAWRELGAYHRLARAEDVISCLGDAVPWPVLLGFTVYQSFESNATASSGVMPIPGPNEMMLGGHAVMCIGYDLDKQAVLCRNSWGPGWGLEGNFWMSLSVVDDPTTDKWIIHRGASWKPKTNL